MLGVEVLKRREPDRNAASRRVKYFGLWMVRDERHWHDWEMTERPSHRRLATSYRRLRSVPAVADELGVAFETARRWLIDAEVQLQAKGRPSKEAGRLNPEVLAKRYHLGESIATIGAAYDVSPATVRARLISAGVELRPRRGWKY